MTPNTTLFMIRNEQGKILEQTSKYAPKNVKQERCNSNIFDIAFKFSVPGKYIELCNYSFSDPNSTWHDYLIITADKVFSCKGFLTDITLRDLLFHEGLVDKEGRKVFKKNNKGMSRFEIEQLHERTSREFLVELKAETSSNFLIARSVLEYIANSVALKLRNEVTYCDSLFTLEEINRAYEALGQGVISCDS